MPGPAPPGVPSQASIECSTCPTGQSLRSAAGAAGKPVTVRPPNLKCGGGMMLKRGSLRSRRSVVLRPSSCRITSSLHLWTACAQGASAGQSITICPGRVQQKPGRAVDRPANQTRNGAGRPEFCQPTRSTKSLQLPVASPNLSLPKPQPCSEIVRHSRHRWYQARNPGAYLNDGRIVNIEAIDAFCDFRLPTFSEQDLRGRPRALTSRLPAAVFVAQIQRSTRDRCNVRRSGFAAASTPQLQLRLACRRANTLFSARETRA